MKKYITTAAVVIAMISFGSCEFAERNELIYPTSDKVENDDVALNVKEAKLFTQIAKLNLKILEVNKLVLQSQDRFQIKILANDLEKVHMKIQSRLNETANEKLILIPNKLTINLANESDEENLKNSYLNEVYELMEEEAIQLKKLEEITNDIDLKIMVVKIMPLIESNLDQLEKIKESLII